MTMQAGTVPGLADIEEPDVTTIALPPLKNEDESPGTAVQAKDRTGDRRVGLIGTLVIFAGVLLGASGAGTWAMVQNSLADERITVAEDAQRFAGDQVNGPFTAYYQADIIETHSLKIGGGKTYSELDREDPVRATVMNGSFLRASLFTSVVAFGIAALAMGLGVLFVLIGLALRAIARPARHAS